MLDFAGQHGRKMNNGHYYENEIGPGESGQSLLRYLAGSWTHSSEEEWRERIAAGGVTVNGRAAEQGLTLKRGMKVGWKRPPWEEPEVDWGWRVLREDRDLLAVFKPAGLPTLPGANFLEHTLLHQVRRRYPEASPAHRLGRWTSGILMFTRHPRAADSLARQLAEGTMLRRYRALAEGNPEREEWEIDVPIGPVEYPKLGKLFASSAKGRVARSRVRVLERRDHDFLCDVCIATGRPHQIRIHLASSGHPLVGDPLYGTGGVPKPECTALPGDRGYTLHAGELCLRHPTLQTEWHVHVSPPFELRTSAESRGGER